MNSMTIVVAERLVRVEHGVRDQAHAKFIRCQVLHQSSYDFDQEHMFIVKTGQRYQSWDASMEALGNVSTPPYDKSTIEYGPIHMSANQRADGKPQSDIASL